ncbi:hypothetical protein QFZ55_000957 [Streptomyces luteogriseus]|nr:hypothetical protein [Streptomyces luteogriseus]MDQ0711505.1 hypothetical protein [Streptomyces luteogriseus]
MAQQQREPDGDDEHVDEPGAPSPQRAPDAALDRPAQQGAEDHRGEGGGDEVPARTGRGGVEEEREGGADRDELTVREVDQVDGAEDQREPDRCDRDDHSELDTVDQRLQSARGERGAARDFLTLGPRKDRGRHHEDQGEARHEHPLIAHGGSGTSRTSLMGSV